MLFRDQGGKAIGKDDAVARPQPAGSAGEGAPCPAAEVAVQGDLDRRLAAAAGEPRRDHLGVVEDEEITRPQQGRQIGDAAVRELAGRRDQQQPGRISRRARVFGDQRAGQVEIELVEAHRERLRPTGDQSAADREILTPAGEKNLHYDSD